VSSREERLARNEAASREINEKIEEAYQGEPPANRIDIVCECARMTCDAAIDITLDEYEDVREDARHFVILPGHFVGDIEWIVYENDRFAVVAKRKGVPADVARDENPRGEEVPAGVAAPRPSLESRDASALMRGLSAPEL
jgi:hypothetical protein